ncbi:binding-protein-dependent transporter inner membrane component [Clostridium senegalense]|uniref:binding-protein-dependent transporter inner membrane component n=1 Tax=Clostridium senegalense TaxID=1465809 RepID=UPI0002882799|nr:binding-protein-dependent transporter inner membrane component [Clostridium senegalense]
MINTATAMAMSKNEIFLRINILENKNSILNIILKGIRFNINMLIISSIIGVYTLGSPIIVGFKNLNIKLILIGIVPIAIIMLILSLLTESLKDEF